MNAIDLSLFSLCIGAGDLTVLQLFRRGDSIGSCSPHAIPSTLAVGLEVSRRLMGVYRGSHFPLLSLNVARLHINESIYQGHPITALAQTASSSATPRSSYTPELAEGMQQGETE